MTPTPSCSILLRLPAPVAPETGKNNFGAFGYLYNSPDHEKITLLFLITGALIGALLPLSAQAQLCLAEDSVITEACCNGFITTDPEIAANPARPDLRNRFDWRTPLWAVYIPAPGGGFTQNGTQPLLMNNPFFSTIAQLEHLNFANYPPGFANPDSLDFHPADGWELLYKYDGFDSLRVNYLYGTNNLSRPNPVVILYNRYTGRLRIFSALQGISHQTNLMQTEIRFRTRENAQIKPSALLMKHRNIAQPLSEKTAVESAVTVSKPSSNAQFFVAEFDLAYDPCVCVNNSSLRILFGVVDTANVQLSGRLVGTSNFVSSSGQSPLLNDQDFLASVYRTGLDVNTGTLTYKNVSTLVGKYQAGAGLSPGEQIALGILGSVIKSGITGADKWLTGVVDGAVSKGIQDIGLIRGPSGDADTTFMVKTGLKIMGEQTDRILTAMGLRSSPSRPPMPSVIEAEMALVGRITNFGLIQDADLILPAPGSLGTDDEKVLPWLSYPAYNEPLGVFAVLDSPTVERMVRPQRNLLPHEAGFDLIGLPNYQTWLGPHARYRFAGLKYVFNPAAEVDEEKTVILGALVVKGPPADRIEESFDPVTELTGTTYSPLAPNIDLGAGQSNSYYVSPFLPLECLQDFVAGDFDPAAEVYLRLMIQFVHKENLQGKVNQTFEILTYPVRFASQTLDAYAWWPDTLVVDGSQPFTQSVTLHARDVIQVTGALTLSPEVTVTLAAGREVSFGPNTTLIPPNVITVIGPEGLLGCKRPAPEPASKEELKTFCASSHYKANQLANRTPAPFTPAANWMRVYRKLLTYPNPFDRDLTLTFTLDEPGISSARLIDGMGRELLTLWRQEAFSAGLHSRTFDLSDLAPGVYVVVLETAQGPQTARIIRR